MSVCLGKFTDQTCRRPVPAPTDHDIEALVLRLAQRLGKLARHRFEQASEELDTLDTDTLPLRSVSAEAIQIPGPRTPRHQTDIFGEGPPDDQGGATPAHKPLCARVQGFSLHAARVVESSDRDGLERLCRYGLRAPFSQDRLSLTTDRLLRPVGPDDSERVKDTFIIVAADIF